MEWPRSLLLPEILEKEEKTKKNVLFDVTFGLQLPYIKECNARFCTSALTKR
jgi:hypothetical protein